MPLIGPELMRMYQQGNELRIMPGQSIVLEGTGKNYIVQEDNGTDIVVADTEYPNGLRKINKATTGYSSSIWNGVD
jgi:hypothetical protein